jgi:FkbM family methyltransferase
MAMDAIVATAREDTAGLFPVWPEHDQASMARDFLFWRHLRVLRARGMRHVHRLAVSALGARPGNPSVIQTVYGVRMEANWKDRTFAYCHYGTYGTYLADLLGALDQPFAFLDIGANQGLFSLIAARNPACKAIVALEPVPDTHARLTRNLALNGALDRAQALNFGLSDCDGTRQIATCKAHSGVATLEDHLTSRLPSATSIAVEMRTIDSLLLHLPRDLPLFVKIDVEGHEATVITQLLGSSLAKRVIGIFYEHDSQWSDGAAIEHVLARGGFAVMRRYGRGRHFDALALPLPIAAIRAS